MPYAAVITSAALVPHLLEEMAPSFCSPIATIRKFQNRWILQSSTFEPYESDEKLFEAANSLLTQIHLVLSIYLGIYSEPLSVRALSRLSADRSAFIPDSRSHSDRLPNGKVPAGPASVQPLRNARIGGYHAFVAAKLVVHSGNTGSAGANRSR
jgi:hypothetical protein